MRSFVLFGTLLMVHSLLSAQETSTRQQQTSSATNVVLELPRKVEPPKPVTFMFVQSAERGTMTPIDVAARRYRLSLEGVSPQTIYFSDRPQRIAGGMELGKFVARFPFGEANPPNAAIALADPKSESEDVIVGELTKPQYDAAKRTLSYEVTLMTTSANNLAFFAPKVDDKLPESFERVSIFIDDCSDQRAACFGSYQCAGKGHCCRVSCGALQYTIGYCWDWYAMACTPCRDHSADCDKDLCTSSIGLCIKGQCANSTACTG